MVTYADPKSKTETRTESDQRPAIHVTQSSKGNGSTIAYIVVAIVLLAGAYFLYTNNMSTTTVVPSVTQNNTTIAPDPVEPAPATPPAMEQTTPPAPVPATPPATEPVAP
jgi:flagellar basal body-associated protein FliL